LAVHTYDMGIEIYFITSSKRQTYRRILGFFADGDVSSFNLGAFWSGSGDPPLILLQEDKKEEPLNPNPNPRLAK